MIHWTARHGADHELEANDETEHTAIEAGSNERPLHHECEVRR